MFSYDENLRRLERVEERYDELEGRRDRLTEAEAEERGELYADIGELRAWIQSVQRES